MNALQFTEKGNLDSLRYVDVPDPVLAEGEVLVEIKAAAINPSDVKNVQGSYPATTVPRISGRDFAGIVRQGSPEWQGKAVFGCALDSCLDKDGAHAELMAVSAEALLEKPEGLSFEKAATLGIPYLTAWETLQRAKVSETDRVVILGGGAVARAARCLLAWQGVTPLLALRSVAQRKTWGAVGQACVDASNPAQLPSLVEAHFGGLADVVFDTTGQLTEAAVLSSAKRARVAVIAAPPSGNTNFPLLEFYRRGLTLIGEISLLNDNKGCRNLLAALLPGLQSGDLVPDEPVIKPLANGVAVYQAVANGNSDKVVFVP